MLHGAFASAQVPALPAHRAAAPPKIDGKLDDPLWEAATKTPGFVDPFTGRETADRTHAWLAYDNEAVYVAFQCFESRMDQLVAREMVPGSEMETDDRVTFLLDPLNTKTELGLSYFTVNPAGTQTEHISGGRTTKREWRGVWQAAIVKHADSWTVEMRIPWRIFTYAAGGARDMTLNFTRYQARTSVASEWANRTAAERPELNGQWKGAQPPPPPAAKLEHLPYVAPEWNDGRFDLRAGIDVRYRFTDRLTSVTSFKPDFRNIEGQIAGIDFQRSERFLEDVRPFFTEGGSLFDMTPMFSFARMFYSRRIGEFDFGTKVFGSINDRLRVAALATVDGDNRKNGAFRIQQLTGPRSWFSLFGTAVDGDGAENHVLGGTMSKLLGNFSVNAQAAASTERGNRTDGGSAALDYSVPKFFTQLRYSWIDPGFEPDLALVPFTDRRGFYMYNEHNNDYRTGPLKRLHGELYLEDYKHYDGDADSRGYTAGLDFSTRSDIGVELFYNDFRFEGIPDRTWWVEVTANESNRFRQFSVGMESGRRENEETRFLNVEAKLRTFKNVDLGLSRSVLDFMGETNQTIFTLAWEIDRARSLSGRFVEMNGKRNYYAAFRNAGFAGMEMYVVLGDPNAESFKKRLSVKFVWAF